MGAGTKCRQELAEQGPPGWFCRGSSRAGGWGSGGRGWLGSLSPCSPGAEMRISDSLTLDLCRCCSRVFGSAVHPSISSPGHPVTGDMEQAVQGLGREVTRHTNELQHPSLEKKKKSKKADFLFAALKRKLSITSEISGPNACSSLPEEPAALALAERNWH